MYWYLILLLMAYFAYKFPRTSFGLAVSCLICVLPSYKPDPYFGMWLMIIIMASYLPASKEPYHNVDELSGN